MMRRKNRKTVLVPISALSFLTLLVVYVLRTRKSQVSDLSVSTRMDPHSRKTIYNKAKKNKQKQKK